MLQVDPLNCGGCHNVCPQGINCCLGQCQDCPAGSFKCKNNLCTNLGTDPQVSKRPAALISTDNFATASVDLQQVRNMPVPASVAIGPGAPG